MIQSIRGPLISVSDLDRQRELLSRNTRQFVTGLPANHVLLWGARGMGKSSLVKAGLPFPAAFVMTAAMQFVPVIARRAAAVREAIAAGKAIYCEKPTADTLDEALARAHPYTGDGLHLQMQDDPCDYARENRFEGGAPAPRD